MTEMENGYCSKFLPGTKSRKREQQERWRANNPDYARQWVKDNPDKIRANNRRWREKNRDKTRAYSWKHYLKTTYGISVEQYQAILASSGGVCAICSQKARKMVLDHNHTTMKVRGILCDTCNRALGMFKDNAPLLRRAAKYVETQKGGFSSPSPPRPAPGRGQTMEETEPRQGSGDGAVELPAQSTQVLC
jgi:hypothetical protein